jgi:hypothetical protein
VPGLDNTFEIRVDPRAPKAEVQVYIPAEAHLRNMDRSRSLRLSGGPGALIAIMLHVGDDGYLEEVEQELAVPPELFGPLPDITEFELRIPEWTFLEGG